MSVKCLTKPLSIGIDFDIGISDGLSLLGPKSNVRPFNSLLTIVSA
jgi:hypothetical protein